MCVYSGVCARLFMIKVIELRWRSRWSQNSIRATLTPDAPAVTCFNTVSPVMCIVLTQGHVETVYPKHPHPQFLCSYPLNPNHSSTSSSSPLLSSPPSISVSHLLFNAVVGLYQVRFTCSVGFKGVTWWVKGCVKTSWIFSIPFKLEVCYLNGKNRPMRMFNKGHKQEILVILQIAFGYSALYNND